MALGGEGGEGRGGNLGLAEASYCRLQTGWISKKALLCSPGNCIQHPVTDQNGTGHGGKRERERVCVCVCVAESLCCTAENKHNVVNQLYFKIFFN